MRILIVGCGYVGTEVVRIAPSNWTFSALTRSTARVAELHRLGVQPIVADWLEVDGSDLATAVGPSSAGLVPPPPTTETANPRFDVVLCLVPQRPTASLGAQTHAVALTRLAAALAPNRPRFLYLSTTGVYGSAVQGEVTEETPVAPERESARVAWAAEQWIAQHGADTSVIVRSAGIYGPGRLPLLAALQRGEPLPVEPNARINLVHVHDLARALMLLIERPPRHRRYVLADGQAVLRSEFYRYLADLYHLSPPAFAPPSLPSRRGSSDRSISPRRFVDEFGFEFVYPDYRHGLSARGRR
ncbi:MAG: hypothetical protein KatS3mg111_3291 [Pirellulaceae bacterium]|nr:MAG: hypothetical protein KatS3mg111_3291 [Pirellulaceae bacterium]